MNEKNDDSKCPCCGLEFKSAISMKNHIVKINDCKHKLLAFIYNELKIKCKDITVYYNGYKDYFDRVSDDTLSKMQIDLVEHIKQIEYAQKEKIKEEKDKLKKENELKKITEEAQRLKEIEEQRTLKNHIEKHFFDNLPVEDRPKALVTEFYNMINSQCFNYMLEIQLIRGLYLKNKFDTVTIRKILKYMANMGYSNLRSINYILNDVFMFYDNVSKIKQAGTIPYLIKYFYDSMKMKMNKKYFIKEVKAIESSMRANDLTIEQVKNIIDGMIKEKIKVLLWFDSKVSQYRDIKQQLNPCRGYSDEREIEEAIEEIKNGRMKLSDVSKRIYNQCMARLRQVYMEGSFDSKYTYFEWAFKVGLSLDKEMYALGQSKQKERQSRFETALQKYADNINVKNKIYSSKKHFEEWLIKQPAF